MLLALSIVALLAGPAVYTFGRRNRIARQILDGFIFITIAGIVTVHIIPEALVGGGNLVGGVEQVLIVNESSASGHDPATGRLLWSHRREGRSNANANVSNAVAVPPDSLTALRIPCPMIAPGTSSPSATVPLDSTGSTWSRPCSNERTTGAQFAPWTATMRGSRWRSRRAASRSICSRRFCLRLSFIQCA